MNRHNIKEKNCFSSPCFPSKMTTKVLKKLGIQLIIKELNLIKLHGKLKNPCKGNGSLLTSHDLHSRKINLFQNFIGFFAIKLPKIIMFIMGFSSIVYIKRNLNRYFLPETLFESVIWITVENNHLKNYFSIVTWENVYIFLLKS